MVQLKLIPVHSGDTDCSTFGVKPFVRKNFSVGKDFLAIDGLKQQNSHLEAILLERYRHANVERILSQDTFHVIRPLDFFETNQKSMPIAVQIPLGWVLSGPLPSTSGLLSTCFKVVTQIGNDFSLADQFRSWYNMQSFGAYKKVDPRSASDARSQKTLEDTTYHDGFWNQVGM